MSHRISRRHSASALLDRWFEGNVHSHGKEVFDRARFLANVNGDVDVLREIAGRFVQDCASRLVDLRHALARRDRVALESLAHMLKGSAGYIGAQRMLAAAEELEAIARSGDLEAVERACTKLKKAIATLTRALIKSC